MYKYTDKVLKVLRRRFMKAFSAFQLTARFDQLNVLSNVTALYSEIAEIAKDGLLRIARHSYMGHGGKRNSADEVVEALLLEYNPVTKYVYEHEVERKCARFAESMVATNFSADEIKRSLRYWAQMVSQYALDVTDRAALRAYEETGVESVVWVTVPDERRCKTCRERDGVIYPISNVPRSPHWGCRCYLLPYPTVGGDR